MNVTPPGETAAGEHTLLPHRQLLGDSVYEAVKALVMDHVLAPGERVSIERFARELGVSPTPLREALARLEADGLMLKEPMRGYSVAPLLTRRELAELYELRLLLEPWGARSAAMRATPSDLLELGRELGRFPKMPREASNYAGYRAAADHDTRLHGLVFRAAGNEAIAGAYERTRCHLHMFRIHYRYRPEVTRQTLGEHKRIVTAITAGESDAADAAMREHILLSRERLAGIQDQLR